MIEIGRKSSVTWATHRISNTFSGMAALVMLVWLIRPILPGIQAYSVDLLLTAFGFGVLGRVFDTRTNAGVGRAIASFFGNLTASSVIIIVLIWILNWVAVIQSDSVTGPYFLKYIPDLVIAAIATGLVAYAAHHLSPREKRAFAKSTAFLVPASDEKNFGDVKLAAKRDSAAIPVVRSGRSVGCVLQGDLAATFDTPMGVVKATLVGPVTTSGIAFRGKKLSESETVKLTGKSPKQLADESNIDSVAWGKSSHTVDAPFVHVEEGESGNLVEVGPIRVSEGPGGDEVKIGPFTINADEKRWKHGLGDRLLAKGAGGSYITADRGRVSAKWNGSSLTMEWGSMNLSAGSDSFYYSPIEVKTASPLHKLRVSHDKVTLDTAKFALSITGDKVVLRSEDKTTSTESKSLAGDLRALLTETAKSQVKDVMEGVPIDLSEMLAKTEEVLSKHA